jgi:hypothetical protein
MLTRADETEMRQRGHDTDGAVSAHAEIANIIEEDDARGVTWIYGFAQEGPYNHLRPARFGDDFGSKTVMVLAERPQTIWKIAGSKVGSAVDNDPGGFSGGMRINDAEALERRNRAMHG